MSLCEWTDLLDPRPRAEAEACPISRGANIPLAELPKRMHELPAKGNVVKVCDLGVLAGDTVMLLEERGHRCAIVPFEYEYGFQSPQRHSGGDEKALDGVMWRSVATMPRYRLWEPNSFLMSVVREVRPGDAIDLGCGSGRDAVALADQGWQVTAVDILPDALDKGKDLLRRYAPASVGKVRWQACDIALFDAPAESADLVVCNLFFDPRATEIAASALRPGGLFVCETFTETHRREHNSPQEKRVVSREALERHPSLTIAHWSEGWSSDRHLARIVARKL